MIDAAKLKKMRVCSHLLPDPGGEVVRECLDEIERLMAELTEFTTKEGPLNAERWTLDQLLTELEKWKVVASGKTCVSFENLCYGASSLWHKIHRENFRLVDRKPEALSRWVLNHAKCVMEDFPTQVLEILTKQQSEIERLRAEAKEDVAFVDSQKAEIERLWKCIDKLHADCEAWSGTYHTANNERAAKKLSSFKGDHL